MSRHARERAECETVKVPSVLVSLETVRMEAVTVELPLNHDYDLQLAVTLAWLCPHQDCDRLIADTRRRYMEQEEAHA